MTYYCLYTLGYSGWTAEQIEDTMLDLGAVLVDVRLSAQSRKPGFSNRALLRRFSVRYTHMPDFGNVNYNRPRAPVKLRDPEAGLTRLSPVLQCWPVIIMCTCRRLQTCHRLTVAELAVERLGVAVEHLEGPPASAGTVRCISLHQPWATLCCLPHPADIHKPLQRAVKGFETRSWPTSYIGPLLIHAAKRNTREQREAFRDCLVRSFGPAPGSFPSSIARCPRLAARFFGP